jgi:N-acetylmuramoyl-L-alanine amidase
MTNRVLAALATAACLLIHVRGAAAQPATARAMYTHALEQERTVRDDANKPTLAEIRRVVTAYEAVVRKHPTSGYSDNALWQGGNLAVLAYDRFGDDADRKTATRLFAWLVKEYPSSTLVKGAREALAAPAPAPAPALPPTPAQAPPAAAAVSATSLPAGGSPPSSQANLDTQKPKSEPSVAGLTSLKDVQRAVLPDGIRVTINLDAEVAYHQEEIANPRRLFFDLKGVKAPASLQDATLKFDGDVVKEVRLGRHPQNTTRLVIDLDGISSYTVYPLYGPYRLVVDLQRASAAAPDAQRRPLGIEAAKPFMAPALLVDNKTPAAGVAVSAIKPPVAPASAPPSVAQPKPKPQATSGDSPAPLPSRQADPVTASAETPAANSSGKLSLSRQLGLSVSRIVIDAGHGGHDPGAHGNGINESELTLDVAQRLQKLLDKQPGFEVVMTRDTDEFIPLQERTAIANREGADLFLSIHANASRNPQAHGIETYFLNFATNPEAEAVAARENAASGQAMHSLPDIVKAIALNNKINESRDFAATVQKSMVKHLNSKNHAVRDLGVKQAPFVVLIGATMPSVLAEISFLTNKQDGTVLKTPAYRQQIAQALFEAIQNYQQALNRANSASGKKATSQ